MPVPGERKDKNEASDNEKTHCLERWGKGGRRRGRGRPVSVFLFIGGDLVEGALFKGGWNHKFESIIIPGVDTIRDIYCREDQRAGLKR